MSGHAVRQRFVREFRGLSVNSRDLAVTVVASYILQVAAAVAAGWWLLQPPVSLAEGLVVVLLMLFIGTRLRGFNNIVHECSHFAFTERREDNVLLGSICASMVLGTFASYRDEHITHHAHVGDYDHDLDLQGIRKFRLEDPLTARTVLRHVLTPLLGLHLPYYLRVSLSPRDGRAFRIMKLGLIAGAVLLLAVDPLAALLMVWVPFAWVYPTINYWTDCIDHGGLIGSRDELQASRNFAVPRRLRALLFPRNDCFHLVHHLFPQVPSQHLEACHQRLMSDAEYRTRVLGAEGKPTAGRRDVDEPGWTVALQRLFQTPKAHPPAN